MSSSLSDAAHAAFALPRNRAASATNRQIASVGVFGEGDNSRTTQCFRPSLSRRARQLRDEPQSGRYPTRGYQQRQPSLERGAADQTDLNNPQPGKSGLRRYSHTMRREISAQLTEDSHINDRGSAAAVGDPHDATTLNRRRLQPLVRRRLDLPP